jgi:hypothetical protein
MARKQYWRMCKFAQSERDTTNGISEYETFWRRTDVQRREGRFRNARQTATRTDLLSWRNRDRYGGVALGDRLGNFCNCEKAAGLKQPENLFALYDRTTDQ